ncbi:hypothetical protein HWV62_5582 [Athelia sp. TMB]|nr:hypothetical protein HWV62_5582 [Athelia sp. TMB]
MLTIGHHLRRAIVSPLYSTARGLKTIVIPNQFDNYSYLIVDDATNKAAVVDTSDVARVEAAAERHGVQIVANLSTHHHPDPTGGNEASKYSPDQAPIYGGSSKIPRLTKLVRDKDEFSIGNNLRVKCYATPCHTKDSFCYYVTDKADSASPGALFTGDTLLIAGCGRFFEGSGAEMLNALRYIYTLPEDTIVYNGHEYTSENVRLPSLLTRHPFAHEWQVAFGKLVEPTNEALDRLQRLAEENKITTGLTSLKDEKEWNVFLRMGTDAQKMDRLREWKNKFSGPSLLDSVVF